jgi:hypothetical protein
MSRTFMSHRHVQGTSCVADSMPELSAPLKEALKFLYDVRDHCTPEFAAKFGDLARSTPDAEKALLQPGRMGASSILTLFPHPEIIVKYNIRSGKTL